MQNLKYRLGQLLDRKLQHRALPQRIAIMLTTPRSGSTWFVDAIRCHPGIQFWPNAAIYTHLSLIGRRYPRDLSGGTDATYDIEVTRGKWEKIPDFYVPETLTGTGLETEPDKNYAIEKCHPEFFGFKTHKFLRKIEKLENQGIEIKMIYLVRDPEASFNSFMNYQHRNPTWYPSVRGRKLATYMDRSFASILEAAGRFPGLVTDYSDIKTDFTGTLEKIYTHIWPRQDPAATTFNAVISKQAEQATVREKRSDSGTSFLGKTAGSVKGGLEDSDPFLAHNRDAVTRCYNSYEQLLKLHRENG